MLNAFSSISRKHPARGPQGRRPAFPLLAVLFICLVLTAGAVVGPEPEARRAREQGEYLYHAANCVSCHPRASLRFLERYSLSDFSELVRDGKRPGGASLSPVMPFAYFYGMTDADTEALHAFIAPLAGDGRGTGAPSSVAQRPGAQDRNQLPPAQRFWPDAFRDAQWNRGAYLATVLGHCGQCHTAAEKDAPPLAGGKAGTWDAYNITSHPGAGIGSWSAEELESYLRQGVTESKGYALGPMSAVVENSLSRLTRGDAAALVAYVRTVPAGGDAGERPRFAWGTPVTSMLDIRKPVAREDEQQPGESSGKALYAGKCASCHGWQGTGLEAARGGYPGLVGNTTVGAPGAANLIQVVLWGSAAPTRAVPVTMPSFAREMTDEEMALLLGFVTAQFGDPSAAPAKEDIAALRGRGR